MRFVAYGVVASMALSPIAGFAAEPRGVISEQQACEVLKRAAVEFCLSRTNLAGRYYCDSISESPMYYVLGLRYHVTSDELVGSNLIGWFAISKSDGTVFNWDITEDQPTRLVSNCPVEHE